VRVVYDHRIFALQRFGGVSRYFYEVARRIATYPDAEVTLLALAHMNGYLKRGAPFRMVGRYIPHIPSTGRPRRALNDLLTRRWLERHPTDILHQSYYPPSPVPHAARHTVVTVYDMIHERLPQHFPRDDRTSQLKADAVARASHVICISDHTKRDLVEILRVEPAKISVVHLGSPPVENGREAPAPLFTEPYLLFVGERTGYKNFTGFVRAFAGATRLRNEFRLVCIGGGVFTRAERTLFRELGLEDGVRLIVGDDRVLTKLYSHAAALVYPSLYEGFGMPPLEAMAMSCPVACSSTASLPEVVGDAAELFDPLDPDDMIAAVERVVYSTQRRETLLSAGRRRLNHFSWDRCAAQTHAVYRALL
jgi:glycosyltransferase involved in cell wall biosynthesis